MKVTFKTFSNTVKERSIFLMETILRVLSTMGSQQGWGFTNGEVESSTKDNLRKASEKERE